MVIRFARPTAAMSCPWTRMVMSCCGVANSWIDDGDMGERKAPGLCVNHPANPNSGQSRNRERKIDLKRWDRI